MSKTIKLQRYRRRHYTRHAITMWAGIALLVHSLYTDNIFLSAIALSVVFGSWGMQVVVFVDANSINE